MNGMWISNGTAKPFYARKKIMLDKKPETALLSICASGQYDFWINGKRVGEDVLRGAWTDYNKRILYNTYDVASALLEGGNELVIEVANGWYIADTDDKRHFYTVDKGYRPFGKYLCLMAELTADGEKFETDGAWEVLKSATTFANVYGSEDFDNQYFQKIGSLQWQPARILSAEEAPRGQILEADYPPVTVIHSYQPIRRDILKDGSVLIDFGQNMSGQFEIQVAGTPGTVVRVTPYEKLREGVPEATVQTYSEYTLAGSGGRECFRPRFSYAGGRWITVELVRGAADLTDLDASAYFISSSSPECGTFHCDNEKLNAVYQMILHAIESNINHCHTDCPTIEKLGWLEPNHLMAPSIMYAKDVEKLWMKILQDIIDAQYEEGEEDTDLGVFPHEYRRGLIPSIAPRYARFITDWGSGSFWDIIPWGSSLILIPYYLRKFYGNTDGIRLAYPAMKKYIAYLERQYDDYERLYGKKGAFICGGLGDWGISQNGGESRENIETAFFYHDADRLAEYAQLLGYEEDAVRYRKLAERIYGDYNRQLLRRDPDTGLYGYPAFDSEGFRLTQANQAIPLQFGLVPEEQRPDVEQSFLNCMGAHFVCGEIGLPYIIRELQELNQNDLLYDLVMNEEHPSYLRFVNCGETTLPEFWRDDARSRNHDMMGHIMEWFYSGIAGIRPDEEGHVSVRPWISGKVGNFECTYRSRTGTTVVKCENGTVTVKQEDTDYGQQA